MSVSEVIEEVRALSQAEKQRVWQELNDIVNEEPIELRLQRALASDGLLNEIKMPFVTREQKVPAPIETVGNPFRKSSSRKGVKKGGQLFDSFL